MLISFTPEELTQHIDSIIKSLDIKDRRKSDINTIDKLVKELEETIKTNRRLEQELLRLNKRNDLDRRALNLLSKKHQETVYKLIESQEVRENLVTSLEQANETTKYYRVKLTKISNLIK